MATKKTAAKKTPVTKSTPAKTTAKKKTIVTKKAVAAQKTVTNKIVASSNGKKGAITPEQRYQLISETAYYLSLRNSDSTGGSSLEDWLQAEKSIDEKYRVFIQ